MEYEVLLAALAAKRRAELGKAEWDQDLIRHRGPGHTPDTAKAEWLHGVCGSSAWYADAKMLGLCSPERGVRILRAVAAHQSHKAGLREEGDFTWYAEEDHVHDFNGGFFTMMPLLRLLTLSPELVTAEERAEIDAMIRQSLKWFGRYCTTTPELYYSNPTISAAVCLYVGAVTVGDADSLEKAERFLTRYFDYTVRRGWGWGESISPSYIMEILPPLKLLQRTARGRDEALAAVCGELMEELLIWVRFHGDAEFVPAIRDYNTIGLPENTSPAKLFAGVTDDPEKFVLPYSTALLFEEEIRAYDANHAKALELQKRTSFTKRVFDDKYAVTWAGKKIHLGTLTEYPVMPGCNQNPLWGIGWQSMPVSFVAKGENLGYLRWEVTAAGRRRCFPNETRHAPTELNAALFNEAWLPDMYTLAAQEENAALVLRRIYNLHNEASEIADELAIPSFAGSVETAEHQGLDWALLRFKSGAGLVLAALNGMTLHVLGDGGVKRDEKPAAQKLVTGTYTAFMSGKDVTSATLTQYHYRGEDRRLDVKATETAWAFIALDEAPEDFAAFLKDVSVRSEMIYTLEVPRYPDTCLRRYTLTVGGRTVTLEHDPFEKKNWM